MEDVNSWLVPGPCTWRRLTKCHLWMSSPGLLSSPREWASMVQRACGKATPWQGGQCGKWERGGHGVRQLGCTLACPEWMCREKPNNPATPFPVKEEVADFLPGVQGRMGQTLQGVTHVGRMVGLAGVGSVPRAQSLCCCQPLMRVSELLPRGGRCPCI